MSIQSGLHIVATPIGNRGDMSPRAIEILKRMDLIFAEDTRTSGRLLRSFGIVRPMKALHEHNERRIAPAIIKKLLAGENVALITDAGTPLISDPGFYLVRLANQAGVRMISIPGPSAVIAALAVSGLPSDRFVFEGFLPAKQGARRKALERLRWEQRTLVFFEAPHRIVDSITDMLEVFGADRSLAFARELTKKFETVRFGTLGEVLDWLTGDENQCKGEIALIVGGSAEQAVDDEGSLRTLTVLLRYLSKRDAIAAACEITGRPRNQLYRLALELSGANDLNNAT